MTTYHVIPHSHWDREWYLSFDHFRVLLVHLVDDLLSILAERDDYAGFLLDGQTVVVDDYLEVKPERRAEVERLVGAGRLSMGPWYVLPDTFLVSGEALVRNLMQGRRTARAFGGGMDVGYIPDSFGHTAQLPQLLRGFGIDTAIVWRGFGGEPGQEGSEYRWRSPDGSEVLMEHLSDAGYSAAYFDDPSPEAALARFAGARRRVDARARTPERLVLSGGDHHWPTASLPDVLAHLNEALGAEARVVHGTLAGFAGALRAAAAGAALPAVEGELRFGYRWAFNVTGGVYSSRTYLKQSNAAAQRLLERYLEPLDALAVLAGGPSQQPLLGLGWRYLLQNHPHDSICGCSIDAVHREMTTRYEKLDGLARGVEHFAWMHLAPEAEEGGYGDDARLTFFNPSPFARDEVATCDVSFFQQQVVVGLNPDVVPDPPRPPVAGFVLEDAAGQPVPFEVVARTEAPGIAYTRYGYPSQSRAERFTVRVLLERLPPLGLRTLRVRRAGSFEESFGAASLRIDGTAVENAHVRVDVRQDGTFWVTDRATGCRYGPLGHFEDGGDAGDLYNYSPPPEDLLLRSDEGADVVVEAVPGRLAAGLRVRGTWRLPAALAGARRAGEQRALRFATTATLTPESRHVLFETEIENTVADHRLRVLFETGCRTDRHHADNAFAVLSRVQERHDPAGFAIEVPAAVAPMHRFVTVEDAAAGATLVADGLPEYELKHGGDGVLALTLLRCVGALSRGDLATRPGGFAGWLNATPEAQCQGTHRFRYAFVPHGPGWPAHLGPIHRAAEAVLLPVRCRPGRSDDVRPDRSFLGVEPAALVLSAFKQAEDGDGLVLRLYNPGPVPLDGQVRLGLPVAHVRRANLEETPGEPVPLRDGVLHDHWPPFRIHTYRLDR